MEDSSVDLAMAGCNDKRFLLTSFRAGSTRAEFSRLRTTGEALLKRQAGCRSVPAMSKAEENRIVEPVCGIPLLQSATVDPNH